MCGVVVYYEYVRAELLRVQVFFAGAPDDVSKSLSTSTCVCVCLLSHLLLLPRNPEAVARIHSLNSVSSQVSNTILIVINMNNNASGISRCITQHSRSQSKNQTNKICTTQVGSSV